ncbi:response regulator [Thermodesulfobacteriota bacterium]
MQEIDVMLAPGTHLCGISDGLGTILIVDDEIYTPDLLKAILTPIGYNIITAKSGKDALSIVENCDVDLILLDIMMPEMNGYEVCKILKGNSDTNRIPILIISALSGLENNIHAIEVGAEGFLAKPFNNQLVTAYVKSLIKMKKLSDEVMALDHLKDDLTKMIIHDLRNPLISALGFIKLFEKEIDEKKKTWYSHVIKNGVTDAFNLMENLHDIIRLESNKLAIKRSKNENIYLIISECIDLMLPVFEKRGLKANFKGEADLCHSVDIQIIKRILQNILANAAKFARKDTLIQINAYKTSKGTLRIEVSNEGDIIPEHHWPMIFKKFGQVELKRRGENVGVGLGLTFCKLAIKAHKGTIWVESPAIDFEDGTSFIFEIK